MKTFLHGFLRGVRVRPLAYFAPAIALWRLLLHTTDSLLGKPAVRKKG